MYVFTLLKWYVSQDRTYSPTTMRAHKATNVNISILPITNIL